MRPACVLRAEQLQQPAVKRYRTVRLVPMVCLGAGLWPVLVSATLAAKAAAPAANEAVAPATPTFRDLELQLQARAALLKEKALASLNIGVSVRQRVATLWGTIPTVELARRAQELVGQVPGLVDVCLEFQLDRSGQPLTRSFAPPSPDRSGGAESPLAGPFQAPAALVGRPTEYGPTSGQQLPWKPHRAAPLAAARKDQDAANRPGRVSAPATVQQPTADSGWRPKQLPGGPSLARASEPAATLLPPVRVDATAPLAELVESIRQKEDRFRTLQADIQGACVYLRGTVQRGDDLFAFAKAISLLSGVERVIVAGVQTTPSANP